MARDPMTTPGATLNSEPERPWSRLVRNDPESQSPIEPDRRCVRGHDSSPSNRTT